MSNQERIVSGFYFEDDNALQEAKKELEAVNYIKSQINMDHPQMVLHAYKQMIQQQIFHTVVGYEFLKNMQNFLYATPEIEGRDVPQIPAMTIAGVSRENMQGTDSVEQETKKPKKSGGQTSRGKKPSLDKQLNVYRKRFEVMSIIAGILLVMVIAMFAITMTSDSPTIVNYREKIVDSYAAWEEELNQREVEVTKREQAVTEREEALAENDVPIDEQ